MHLSGRPVANFDPEVSQIIFLYYPGDMDYDLHI